MLDKIFSPFTTAAPVGVAIRDVVVAIGVILGTLGTLGMLSAEQVDQFRSYLETITDPAVLTSVGVLMTAAMSIYRTFWKSSSDKAAEVAKQIDAKIPKGDTVEVVMPGKSANIKVADRR